MKPKKIGALIAINGFIAIGTIPVCAGEMSNMGGMSMESAPAASYGSPGKSAAVTRTVSITAIDKMRFKPAQLSVRAGQTVRFVIRNAGKLTHEFIIGDRVEQREHEAEMRANPKMKMDHDVNGVVIQPGQVRKIIWTFPAHATIIEYACHEPGHFAAGMVGTIHVVMR